MRIKLVTTHYFVKRNPADDIERAWRR